MNALDLARWQFGITTVYHFLFVPLTIGTAMLVAIMQTAWYRTGDEKWLKATKLAGAGGTKGSLDVAVADNLLAKIDEIAEIFWETKKA